MLKLLVFIYTLSVCDALYPGKLFREEWGNQLMAINLINLTLTICKDAMYKLRMADRIQEAYKYTLPYELGLLTSSITDYFKHMLRIYRFYSNPSEFRKRKYNITNILNAYHVMQGEYNLIRAEKDLYYDVIDRHQKQQALENKRLAAKNRGSNQRSRRAMFPATNFTAFKYIPTHWTNKNKLNNTVWNKISNDTEEAAYKKSLRYKMWAEKWKGFNPEIEGVNIPDKVAAVGLANASNFLVKELKGII